MLVELWRDGWQEAVTDSWVLGGRLDRNDTKPKPQHSDSEPPSQGPPSPQATWGPPCAADGDGVSDLHDPEHQAELRLRSAHSVRNALDILTSISTK